LSRIGTTDPGHILRRYQHETPYYLLLTSDLNYLDSSFNSSSHFPRYPSLLNIINNLPLCPRGTQGGSLRHVTSLRNFRGRESFDSSISLRSSGCKNHAFGHDIQRTKTRSGELKFCSLVVSGAMLPLGLPNRAPYRLPTSPFMPLYYRNRLGKYATLGAGDSTG
jgi:hypothetical protein